MSSCFESILKRCVDAYSENTIRGYEADLKAFSIWCRAEGREPCPAKPPTISSFIEAQIDDLSIATIKRRLCAIKFAHKMAGHPNPTDHADIKLAVRRAARMKRRRPAQATGMTADMLKQILEKRPPTLAGLRDTALISVGYDTLCRSAELVAMRREHLFANDANEVSVLIPTSKGDLNGDGRIAYLSPQTATRLNEWLEEADIKEGPLFRGLHTGKVSDRELDTSSVRRLVKAASRRAGLNPELTAALSGHSMRVGAAQDMLTAGFDALAIMQAGGWKTPAVVLRYVENASTRELHARRWQALGNRQKT